MIKKWDRLWFLIREVFSEHVCYSCGDEQKKEKKNIQHYHVQLCAARKAIQWQIKINIFTENTKQNETKRKHV